MLTDNHRHLYLYFEIGWKIQANSSEYITSNNLVARLVVMKHTTLGWTVWILNSKYIRYPQHVVEKYSSSAIFDIFLIFCYFVQPRESTLTKQKVILR